MKRLLVGVAMVWAVGTAGTKAPIETRRTDNSNIDIELLFTNDGCSVYRFDDDGNHHYYADCGGTGSGHLRSCGAKCVRYESEELERLKNNVTEPRVLFMPPRKEEL
jgi:hypothetical protein